MSDYGPKQLAASLRTVRGNTIQIAEDIPEKSYSFRATAETRSVAETLIHILAHGRSQHRVHFIERRTSMEGFNFLEFVDALAAEEKEPRSKEEIVDLLRKQGDELAQAVENADEGTLAEHVQFLPGMVPASRSRFDMLLSVKEHEMHHRAQLMLMERLLGITPHLTRQNQERLAAMRAAQASA